MSYRLALALLTVTSVATGIVVGIGIDADIINAGVLIGIQITFGIASTLLFLTATAHTMWLAARGIWRRFRRQSSTGTGTGTGTGAGAVPRSWFHRTNGRRPIGFL